MGEHTFSKQERLNKEIWIKELFEKGSSFDLFYPPGPHLARSSVTHIRLDS
jgi:hypothetical protein